MDFSSLEKNLTDMIFEQQAKLGFLPETVRLYYPLDSLNRILGTELTAAQMQDALLSFAAQPQLCERFGQISVTHSKDRFCFTLPPEMSEAIHRMTLTPGRDDFLFIREFVQLLSVHGCTISQVQDLFRKYSDHVHAQKVEGEDFDYLFYFEDGIPDTYRYCITCEGPHLVYHRYTPGDYEALMQS